MGGQGDQRLGEDKVLVGPQVPHGSDPEGCRQVLGIAVADPGQRRYRRVEKLLQAVAFIGLVESLIRYYRNRIISPSWAGLVPR
jgi:hypothetical protein